MAKSKSGEKIAKAFKREKGADENPPAKVLKGLSAKPKGEKPHKKSGCK